MIEHGIASTHALHAYSCIHNRYWELEILIQTWYSPQIYKLEPLLSRVRRSVMEKLRGVFAGMKIQMELFGIHASHGPWLGTLWGGRYSVEDPIESGHGSLDDSINNPTLTVVARVILFCSSFGISFKPWSALWISSTTLSAWNFLSADGSYFPVEFKRFILSTRAE